jgi:hypothetical protein
VDFTQESDMKRTRILALLGREWVETNNKQERIKSDC